MTASTPWASLAGGVMIGLSAVLLMAWEGRIAGISDIAGRLLPLYKDNGLSSRLGFVLGLVAAPLVYGLTTGHAVTQTVSSSLGLMAVAGFTVGFGSVWGNGCTSGHGACGVARLSPRSLAATLAFMATGILTVFVVRHL